MKPTEAAALLALMRANYVDARSKLTEETIQLWLTELRRLEHGLGEAALRGLLRSCRFWPTLAELESQVQIAREQAARERRERERREAEETFDTMPRPPLQDIPAAVELLGRFVAKPSLPAANDGRCDDCGNQGGRYLIGRFRVCADCGRKRLLASHKLAAKTNNEAA